MQGVTALACTSDSRRVLSGGGEGQVRVWEVTPQGQYMKVALKEHKGAVSCIKIKSNDEEVKRAAGKMGLSERSVCYCMWFPAYSVLQPAVMGPASSGT